MTIPASISNSGVSFTETEPGKWLVSVDGDTRTIIGISQNTFIAEFCGTLPHWCFDHALKACIADMEWQASQRATALAEHAAAEAHNAAIPREHRIAALELECELLRRSDADNSSARLAEANAKLETENVPA